MTENEIELINLVREHKHPEKAITAAIETTLDFVKQLQSSTTPFVADSLEHA